MLAELDATDPRNAPLDARLAAVLQGEAPKDNAERLALAQWAYDTRRYAAGTRLWAAALAADPKLGDNLQAGHRYNAACCAALAGTGRGKDDPAPDEATRARLRGQALTWLRADLAAWSKILDSDDPKARAVVAPMLRHWQEDPDLAGVRDEAELARLPESERGSWRRLWSEVATPLARASSNPPGNGPPVVELPADLFAR